MTTNKIVHRYHKTAQRRSLRVMVVAVLAVAVVVSGAVWLRREPAAAPAGLASEPALRSGSVTQSVRAGYYHRDSAIDVTNPDVPTAAI